MFNLNSVDQTYKYLCEVYELTKSEYVKGKSIKPGEGNGLNHKTLVKYKLLTEKDNKYMWKGLNPPSYVTAYNYYNTVRGKKKDYNYLLSVLKSPEGCNPEEIVEALTIKGACMNTQPITFDTEIVKTGETIKTVEYQDMPKPKEELKPTPAQPDISESLKDIIDLMHDVVNTAVENGESNKHIQNSTSTVIAILKTIQENTFDVAASQYWILREFYAVLSEKVSMTPEEDPKHAEYLDRKEKTGKALAKMKDRVDKNCLILVKYGNGKN